MLTENERNERVFIGGSVYAIGTALMVEMNPDAPVWQMLLAVPAIVCLAAITFGCLIVLGD